MKHRTFDRPMRIAYLFDRDVAEGAAMACESTFVDWPVTERVELLALLNGGGMRAGDTLCVRSEEDLGDPEQGALIRQKIERMGVTIEVLPGSLATRLYERRRLLPTEQQKDHLRKLWASPAPIGHVLARASDIMGAKVDRNKMKHWCGTRGRSGRM